LRIIVVPACAMRALRRLLLLAPDDNHDAKAIVPGSVDRTQNPHGT
jgi:hypothetical protein